MKLTKTAIRTAVGLALGLGAAATLAYAQSAKDDPVAEYRAMFGDDNPAELWQSRGKDLWEQPRGPKNVALAAVCDLGLGKGVVKGAYAQLPRYFKDSDKVEDLDSRLLTCMVRDQGLDRDTLLAHRFGDGDNKSDIEALAAYIADQSRGMPIKVALTHPKEKQAYALGKALFYYRAGTHDFGCSTCHSQEGKRIRLQQLPDLAAADGAKEAMTTWPAYRVSQGEVRTLEWRLGDCFRQQRLPEMIYASEVPIALTLFLAKNAEGGVMAAPGLKR
ncbi:sulfur oxidation c-type cytochrome SoxA [Thermomonas flagellata]|uniref:sulfur oxidation c-type cytochrome SoxA n=1 Tax=Thermomonas flagellata TaxID=2888524 RepID=UPI001F0473E9|nr:sulfur oxidation c-type cytochrome SoxA [Thermomonas flagellata]